MKLAGLVLLAALAARADAQPLEGEPMAGPRMDMDPFESRSPRPMRRSCNGPATWAQIMSCTKVVEPAAKVDPQPSTHTQLITSAGSQFKKLYLQREDGKWVLVQGIELQNHELIEKTVVVGKHKVLRVELRTQHRNAVAIGDLIRLKTVYTCGVPTAESCQTLVTSCQYFQHGVASSTFLGELAITETGPVVTGDRTHASPYCDR